MMKLNIIKLKVLNIKAFKDSRGYTLLEYCAGAAVIAGIIFVALNALGNNLTDLLNALGDWATNRTTTIRNVAP